MGETKAPMTPEERESLSIQNGPTSPNDGEHEDLNENIPLKENLTDSKVLPNSTL